MVHGGYNAHLKNLDLAQRQVIHALGFHTVDEQRHRQYLVQDHRDVFSSHHFLAPLLKFGYQQS